MLGNMVAEMCVLSLAVGKVLRFRSILPLLCIGIT